MMNVEQDKIKDLINAAKDLYSESEQITENSDKHFRIYHEVENHLMDRLVDAYMALTDVK